MVISYSLLLVFIFTIGLCAGSFLNVCIYRIPEAKSIVFPGSMCTGCGNPIKFYDNIPLLSYIFLQGKCRHCNSSISLRYPFVELLTGLFALAVFIKFGSSPETPIYFIFIAVLLVITFIDIDHRIVPDLISLPGIVLFFIASLAIPTGSIKDSLIGIIAGGGILFIVAEFYFRLTKKEGMGGGDVKLLAMIGAMIGWQGVLFTIFVSSLAGSVIGVTMMMIQKKDLKLAVPFGPFLSLGAVTYIFFGTEIIDWYFAF